jgi:predicted 3-demethylubiquinone-9 3-methyltransferase (glyoxalase superfamily)
MKGGVMTTGVMPFLMFQDGRAEEAINRYVEVFGDGRVIFIKRYGSNSVGAKEASIEHAVFEIHGQRVGVTESPAQHVFGFTPAISLFVDFDSQEELDRVFAALSEGGEVMMPLDNYGFSRRFAFIQDRYGVSWQLNLPSE